jgi:hypothetical protein
MLKGNRNLGTHLGTILLHVEKPFCDVEEEDHVEKDPPLKTVTKKLGKGC